MQVSIQNLSLETYDVIIVGSGPAGSLLAHRLAEKNKRCLIIETGKSVFDANIHRDFTNMKGHGHFDGSYWPQHWIRSYGGTSSVWAGWCGSLDARDLASWPISRGDLDPYYPFAAQIMNRDPSIATYSAPDVAGFKQKPYSLSEAPLRVAERFANFYTDAGNVDVLGETTVSQLVTNEARTRVIGLSLFSLPDTRNNVTLNENQTLVLAAGAMGNAQLMLAPSGNSAVGVGNETDMVGRCLMEHPHLYDVGRVVMSESINRPVPPASFGEYADTIVPDDALYNRLGKLGVSIQLEETAVNTEDPTERFLMRKFGAGAVVKTLIVRSEMHPDPENRVTLMGETDPAGLPKIRATCVIGSDDLRTVNSCLSALGQSLAEADTGRVRIDNDLLFREATGGGHTMGTTRMGDDPGVSVVDKNCRAHNYQNLYVAGSSVFTTSGASNPTLTIAALSARLADHLTGAA